MSTNIKGKVFAITGGASGMGLATARELVKRGAKAVSIGDFNEANFGSVKEELSTLNAITAVEVTKVDVSLSSSVESWINGIVEKYSGLDGALNAAGVPQGPPAPGTPGILQETDSAWQRIVSINLNGLFFSCREEVKAMIKLPAAPRAIVNVSSMAPHMHLGGMHAYGASKSGVQHFSENLAVDLRPYGIRVNAVCPGLTETPMQAVFVPSKDAIPGVTPGIPKTITAKDVADTVVWLLSNDAPQVSGAYLPIGAGMP